MKPKSTFTKMPLGARLTIVLFAILGFAAVLYAATLQSASEPLYLLLLSGAAVLGARAQIKLFKGSTLSFLTAVVLLAVIQEGLLFALLVAIIGVTAQTIVPSKTIAIHQVAFNAGMIALTVTATWSAHHWLATATPLDSLSAELTATVLASFVYFLGNSISVSLIISLTKGISMADVWLNHFLYSAPSFLIAGLLALGVLGVINSHNPTLAFGLVSAVSVAYFSSIRYMAGVGRTA